MGLFRESLPREVRSRLSLGPGERVLAHATAEEGTLVATTHALHLPEGRAVPWEVIDQARWSAEGLTFTEVGAGRHDYAVAEPGRLPETVQERVTSTIVVSRHVALTERDDGVRLVARRTPGSDTVTWHARFDEGVDPNDPEINHRAGLALAELRERMGL